MYGHKHVVPRHSTEVASNHSHGVMQFDSNIAEALKVGDKVVLLRNYGGQEYLILGRL
jgi:D-serine deaminase-like pyridoxal phosphate-dependent protein